MPGPADHPTTPLAAVRGAPPRLLHLDNLRTALTVLVVVHHAAVGYSTVGAWYHVEPPTDPSATLLDVLLLLNQSFFMGAFFFLSALFVPGSFDRRGAGHFMRQRLLRLGVPLLLWLVVLRPLIGYEIYLRDDAGQRAGLAYWQYLLVPEPGPMWFVEVLLVFSGLYALWRLTGRGGPAAPSGRTPGAAAVVGFTAALALVTYLWRIAVPMGVELLGLPSPAYLPQYAALFAVGLVAARRGWLEGLSRTAGRLGLAAAGAGALGLLALLATTGEDFLGGGTLPSLIGALCESALAVGMLIGLLVLFRARWSGQRTTGRFLSDNAFAVYVVHPVVLVGVGLALSGVAAPAAVKFALLTVLALPLCWGVAHVARAVPGAREVL